MRWYALDKNIHRMNDRIKKSAPCIHAANIMTKKLIRNSKVHEITQKIQ